MTHRLPTQTELDSQEYKAIRSVVRHWHISIQPSMIVDIMEALDKSETAYTAVGNVISKNGTPMTPDEVLAELKEANEL